MRLLKAIYLFCFFLYSLLGVSKKLKEGNYCGILILNEQKNIELPFNFEVKYTGKKALIIIKNADETIVVDEIKFKGDSVNFKMPIFDTEFRTVLIGNNLEGYWINNYKTPQTKIKFKATFDVTQRFHFIPGKPNPIFEGQWETTFSPNTNNSTKAIGIFHHVEQTDYLTGTFLTETGDYRYLEGIKHNNKLYLSCFDGSHAFLFVAEYKNDTLFGTFYSGNNWQEPWIGRLNNTFKLQDPNTITRVKNENEKINFSFPNMDSQIVTLDDPQFKNKAVILQLMGSWCPNCMDESAYLVSLYKHYKNTGLCIIALAFEKTNDFEKSKINLTRFKSKLNIEYPILITQQVGKTKASESMPMLTAITAFPTTLFLNKQHQIVKVHTGFSGPATGSEYEKFKLETETLIHQLLQE